MTNLDSMLKSRDITLPTKVQLVKAMVFPVVMYGCESWTVKKAERWRIDAFELWCWRRLLRVPWTAKKSNQSILKEIGPGCSLKRMMLKLNSSTLATSCEELTHWKRLWCWERLRAGGEGDERMRWLDGITDSMDRFGWTPGVGDGQGGLACCNSWGCRDSDTTEQLNWSELNHMGAWGCRVLHDWATEPQPCARVTPYSGFPREEDLECGALLSPWDFMYVCFIF